APNYENKECREEENEPEGQAREDKERARQILELWIRLAADVSEVGGLMPLALRAGDVVVLGLERPGQVGLRLLQRLLGSPGRGEKDLLGTAHDPGHAVRIRMAASLARHVLGNRPFNRRGVQSRWDMDEHGMSRVLEFAEKA